MCMHYVQCVLYATTIKMVEPRVQRCNLCDTKLCSVIIFIKWVYNSFGNSHSTRWEKTLPFYQRAELRRKMDKIHRYHCLVIGGAVFHVLSAAKFPRFPHIWISPGLISVAASFVYWFAFWFTIQGREEYAVQKTAYHLGRARDPYTRIYMPEYVKVIVSVILAVEIVTCIICHNDSMCKVLCKVIWFLGTVLQLFSFYFFLHPSFRALFPPENNRMNELVYRLDL